MITPRRILLSGLLAALPLTLPAADEAAPSDYHTRKLDTLPRDDDGNLKVEVWDIVAEEAARNPNSNEARAIQSRPVYNAYYETQAAWKAPERKTTPGKLPNLSDTPTTPRFPLTGKVWPSKPGEASVCLWEDDKLAAMSLGIDDNCATDIPYWKELSKKYGGLNITWNIITGNIDGVIDKPRGPMSGTWDTWRKLREEGYHLASHSMTHLQNPVLADGWPGPEWEAAESKQMIDANVPGQKTTVFVYPGAGVRAFGILGGYYPNSTWRPTLVKHYAAARGGGPNPINQANMIDYFNIRSTTAVLDILNEDNPKAAEYNLNNIFAADPSHPYHKYYRGWASVFIHFINNGKDFDTNPYTVAYGKVLDFYNRHREDLWTGFLDDVALYSQERDTATLTTDEVTKDRITFTLISQMDPDVFDYPLTVKVRLPDDWKTARAAQAGKDVPVQVIIHEGAPYALVKARPDRGQVAITPEKA